MSRMESPDWSSRMLPVLGALAVIFPLSLVIRPPSPTGGASETGRQAAPKGRVSAGRAPKSNSSQKTASKSDWEHNNAARMVAEFLCPKLHGNDSLKCDMPPGGTYAIDFIIATVPDPVDSSLPYIFDWYVDAIQKAIVAGGYLPDRFDLPWLDGKGENDQAGGTSEGGGSRDVTLQLNGPRIEIKENGGQKYPRFETEPGLVLFRKTEVVPGTLKIKHKLLLLFLVGETPTAGIHKAALASALDQMTQFYPWKNGQDQRPPYFPTPELPKGSGSYRVKLMGPSFSGSAESLDLTLTSWFESVGHPRNVRISIISGAATAILPPGRYFKEDYFRIDEDGQEQGFRATMAPTVAARERFFSDYVRDRDPHAKIALLVEATTAFGRAKPNCSPEGKEGTIGAPSSEGKSNGSPGTSPPGDGCKDVLQLSFPLHISQLRSAAEKARRAKEEATPELNSRPQLLPLPLEESGARKDSIPPVPEDVLDVPAQELIMRSLLSTISQEGIRYVGIQATDILDTIFLAREVREHCPGAVLFSFDSNLVYLHPEANPSTEGMLVITSYPLFGLDQLWSYPFKGEKSVLQFPRQSVEGVYNATLALLGREDKMLEYGRPFEDVTPDPDHPESEEPALWVTAVGRNGLWPLKLLDERKDPKAEQNWQNYVFRIHGSHTRAEAVTMTRGIYPDVAVVPMICLSLLFMLPAGAIVWQYAWVPGRKKRGFNARLASRATWLSKLFGDTVLPKHRSESRLFLLACCASLLIFYLVASAAFLLPVLGAHELGMGLTKAFEAPTRIQMLLGLVVAGALLLLVWGTVSLTAALVLGLIQDFKLLRRKSRPAAGSPPPAGLTDVVAGPDSDRAAAVAASALPAELSDVLAGLHPGGAAAVAASASPAELTNVVAGLHPGGAAAVAARPPLAELSNVVAGLHPGGGAAAVASPFPAGLTGWRFLADRGPLMLIATALVANLALAITLVRRWSLESRKPHAAMAFFTYLRAVNIGSGLSPLVPLCCVGVAGFLWAFCSNRRLRLIEGLQNPATVPGQATPPPEAAPSKETPVQNSATVPGRTAKEEGERKKEEETAPPLTFLELDTLSFKGVRILEERLRESLERPSAVSASVWAVVLPVAFMAGVYFWTQRLAHFMDSDAFYWLFGLSFFFVYGALFMSFIRLVLVWSTVRLLLRRLSWHPMRPAYERYHKNFPGLPKINFATPPPGFTVLDFSVEQAERLLGSARAVVGGAFAAPPLKLNGIETFGERLYQWISTAAPHVREAGANLSLALQAEARGHWRQSLTLRRVSQRALSRVTRTLGPLLEPCWKPADHRPSAEAEDEKEFVHLGEEFIVGRAVHLLCYAFPCLQTLGCLVLAGLLLMLVAVVSYPFQPRGELLFFNWTVILSFVGVALVVLVQAERDPVLSALNGTNPGEINWHAEFIVRIAIYVVLPILALLGAQFPDTLGQLLAWVGAAQGGHH